MLWMLQRMTPEQLDSPALIYHTHYGRLFPVVAMDNLGNFTNSKSENPVVLALDKTPIETK